MKAEQLFWLSLIAMATLAFSFFNRHLDRIDQRIEQISAECK